MEVYGAYGESVARIREAVVENQLQMRQVEQSLLGFQKGLLGVEREMMPIYKLTEQLRGTQKNIDLSVQELRQINENFVAAHELAPVLLNGSKFDQDQYVKSLQKLLVAITFLEGHRSYEGSVKALDQAKELLVQVLESWKKDIGVSLRSSKQLEAVKLLLVHDLLLARLEALESAALPPLLLRDRDGKGLDDPWILSKAVNAISTDLAETAKQKLFNFHPGRMEASGDRTVTRDGNVHPISSHTLNFLRKVCDQAKPLKILLAKDSDVSAVAFVDTVITQLIGALTAKADQLKGRESLKQLFLINNFGYVANSLPHCVQPDDADLEKQLHVDTIIPAYKAFYDKYSVIQFSRKHASRYLKYTPPAAQNLLRELFSGEACPGDKQSEISSS
ncbi:hypothetical protein JG687_00009590 [Phytophthora cactorum]|uniref:Exocyst subunit Exo70 family protein n=1 Tax=Phytophthora cactorum TaxID=29920 RepID=A0A8T1UDH7_9STRA|nr:hypothetical protein JG687_00009590 [Phytophthora cactorum]